MTPFFRLIPTNSPSCQNNKRAIRILYVAIIGFLTVAFISCVVQSHTLTSLRIDTNIQAAAVSAASRFHWNTGTLLNPVVGN